MSSQVVQHFLDVMYNVTKKQALQLPLETMLQDKLVEHFSKYKEKMGEDDPCTKEELQEFFEDGKAILKYFTSKLDKLYTKSGFELIAIEQRLNAEIKPGPAIQWQQQSANQFTEKETHCGDQAYM